MTSSKLLLGALLALSGFTAGASTDTSDKTDAAQPIFVQQAIKGGMKVESSFDAGSGLTGWVLSSAPGQNIAIYSTDDGQRGIIGTLLDSRGANLTEEHIARYGSKIDYEAQWVNVEKSAYVSEGAKGKAVKKTIYVFKDANCGYCHQAWRLFQNYYDNGLEVRWIPVAFLARDSSNKAAAMLEASNPEGVIAQLHSEWGQRDSSFKNYPVSADSRGKLSANSILMRALGFQGTPAVVYKDGKGKVQVLPSTPTASDMDRIMAGR